MNIHSSYISIHNLNHENQIILLMIPNAEEWHYLAVKKLSPLLRGKTWTNNGDFCCFNCLHSIEAKCKLESHKKVCKIFCNFVILSEDTEILEFNQYRKSDKAPLTIYADLDSLTEKSDGCKNNPEKSSTKKVWANTLSGFSMPTISLLNNTENNHDT